MKPGLLAGIAMLLVAVPALGRGQMVTIDSGRLQGVVSAGVAAYKGVPYAAPPLGSLRWRPPQPVPPWSGIRSAAGFGHDCMQLPFPGDAAPLGQREPAEDCLFVNVWAPEHPQGRLPVLFWIYGGGWVNGGSSPAVYDGSQFAKSGVVFVSFNYRLGRFGFFAHPALSREAAGGPAGNYGYMDQLAALRWVRRNIAAFGGDPGNVTIFGESAGGFSVHMLMTTRLSDGLFERAIVESGGGRGGFHTPLLDRTSGEGRPSGESIGLAFARSHGISGEDAAALAKLRALPAETLVDGLNLGSMFAQADTFPGPMIDGNLLVDDPGPAYERGLQHRVPLIVGANSLEIGFPAARTKDELFAAFGPAAAAARQAYDPDGSLDFRLLAARVSGDQFMAEPARHVARLLSASGQPVWEFRFSYVAESMRGSLPGAPHASEIPFVFDTVGARYGDARTEADEQAARTIHAYWVNFARSGDPNGPGLPDWPKYTTASDQIMDFTGSGPKALPDPWRARLDLAETVAVQAAAAPAGKAVPAGPAPLAKPR